MKYDQIFVGYNSVSFDPMPSEEDKNSHTLYIEDTGSHYILKDRSNKPAVSLEKKPRIIGDVEDFKENNKSWIFLNYISIELIKKRYTQDLKEKNILIINPNPQENNFSYFKDG